MVIRAGTAFARHLRENSTKAERKLWSGLRNRQVGGFKFRRQFPIGRYTADFVCIDAKLIVEVDGSGHELQAQYDARRTAELGACGFHVVRFWNHEVLKHPDLVLSAIHDALSRRF